jgi:2-keto-4-pentenoate hydratase/2-oxohepta-3-ene-1,7-dioic acid hydratase in catechol pathway
MRFISFVYKGQARFGAEIEGGIVTLAEGSLRAAIADGRLDVLAPGVVGRSPDLRLGDVTLLPVIPDPAKILCIGLNYRSHVAETRRPDAAYPTVFVRFADSQVAHGQPLVRPAGCAQFDYEGELAIVIGRGARNVSEADAMDHVAGFACYNDATARDWQRHTSQFTPGKTFPGTGSFGPVLVTPDEVGDWTKLPIATRLNGETVQQATLADLIFPIPRLIAYCSAFTPLAPGDVIVTGTPGGVGDRREPPLYMQPGDVVEVDLGIVGCLRNTIVDAS